MRPHYDVALLKMVLECGCETSHKLDLNPTRKMSTSVGLVYKALGLHLRKIEIFYNARGFKELGVESSDFSRRARNTWHAKGATRGRTVC